jgi:carboxyl-terminal processing protease
MLLEGDPGSKVELGLMRFSHPEPTKISLTRAHIQYPPVSGKMLQDEIGYVAVPAVDAAHLRDVKTKIEELQKQGAKKLILDVRNDPAGTPEDGARLADMFLDQGVITYAQGQKYPRQNLDASAANTITKLPVTVITNRGTAGAAEIAAAALQDAKRAQLVGERTYGNAAVRKAIVMDDGSAIILSVAKYYAPSGKSIQDNGVLPAVQVAEAQPVVEDEDELEDQPQPKQPEKPADDLLLKKAIEVANGAKQASAADQQQDGNQPVTAAPQTPLHIPQQQ